MALSCTKQLQTPASYQPFTPRAWNAVAVSALDEAFCAKAKGLDDAWLAGYVGFGTTGRLIWTSP